MSYGSKRSSTAAYGLLANELEKMKMGKFIIVVVAFATLMCAIPAFADFDKGESAFSRGDYETAYNEYFPLAKSGHAGAQYGIANVYLLGYGDLDSGLAWLKKSADQGYVDALIMLSQFYQRGMGVPQDFDTALKLSEKAAETGDALGQYNLAVTYLTGSLGKQDPDIAWNLLLKAAAQNLKSAQFNLSVMLLKGTGRPVNNVQAYKWLIITLDDKHSSEAGFPIGSFAELRSKAESIKKSLERKLTAEQIAEAQRQAEEWRPQ